MLAPCQPVAHAASPDVGAKTAAIVVKSVKPKAPAGLTLTAYGLTRDDYHRIVSTVPNLRRAVPVREMLHRIQNADRSLDATLVGTTEAFAAAHGQKVVRGRFLTAKDLQSLDNVAVIGRAVAQRLLLDQDPIGKSVRIGQSYYLIVGVVSRGSAQGSQLGSLRTGHTDRQVFVPLSTMRARLGDAQIIRRSGSFEMEQFELSRIEILVADPAKVQSTADAINRMLRSFHEKPDFAVEIVR
jgi:putative ABC transport system permease protein